MRPLPALGQRYHIAGRCGAPRLWFPCSRGGTQAVVEGG